MYIDFITKLNNEKKSSSKNFYIVIKSKNNNLDKEFVIADLNEKYFKIKECLSRCGNVAVQVLNKEELKKILYSFFNTRKDLLN